MKHLTTLVIGTTGLTAMSLPIDLAFKAVIALCTITAQFLHYKQTILDKKTNTDSNK